MSTLAELKERFNNIDNTAIQHDEIVDYWRKDTITTIELGKKLAESRSIGLIHYEYPGWGERLCYVIGNAFLDDPMGFDQVWKMMGGTNIVDYKGWMLIEIDKLGLFDTEAVWVAEWWGKYWERFGYEESTLVEVYFDNMSVYDKHYDITETKGLFVANNHEGIRKVDKRFYDTLHIRWDWKSFKWYGPTQKGV